MPPHSQTTVTDLIYLQCHEAENLGPTEEPTATPEVEEGATHIRVMFEHQGPLGLSIGPCPGNGRVIVCGDQGKTSPVEKNSAAGKVGLILGDVIVAVQGVSVIGQNQKEVKQTIKACQARPIWLDFLRGPQPDAVPMEQMEIDPKQQILDFIQPLIAQYQPYIPFNREVQDGSPSTTGPTTAPMQAGEGVTKSQDLMEALEEGLRLSTLLSSTKDELAKSHDALQEERWRAEEAEERAREHEEAMQAALDKVRKYEQAMAEERQRQQEEAVASAHQTDTKMDERKERMERELARIRSESSDFSERGSPALLPEEATASPTSPSRVLITSSDDEEEDWGLNNVVLDEEDEATSTAADI